MIKKTKDYPEKIANKIREALEYNKNVKEPDAPIKLQQILISRGLYNCGSMAIRDKVCEALGIKPLDASFTIKVHDNVDYQYLLIEFK